VFSLTVTDDEPAEFVTVSVTEYVLLFFANEWNGFGAFDTGELSPKSQSQFVIGHPAGVVDVSVNV
jgi:hypothetical protein